MFGRKRSVTEPECAELISQLGARREVTYVESMSRERIMYNSPSIQDREYTQVEHDSRARDRAEYSLARVPVSVAPQLIEVLLRNAEYDGDLYGRISRLLVKAVRVRPGPGNIYPLIEDATRRTQDEFKIGTLLQAMYEANPSGAVSFCAKRIATLNSIEQQRSGASPTAS